ncbi:NnrS family protein [Sneathiella sp.]|uniref:NnrS family protein n=1 Tax=Sneathiella sp. TaxID=1964365 RepID=UPI00260BABA0|nr:NnrS family protein [Sneathiella sp.]MDF2368940.1 NnrS family protein [Sneathiella sp.]
MAIPRLKHYQGPALLSYGYRPFFLFGSLYAGISIFLWLPLFYGELSIASQFAPVDWHIHEMFFGFLAAVVTGFLFTAIPNWTGRMPIQGTPLLLLVLLWAIGRAAVTFSSYIGWLPAMIVDLIFLATILVVLVNEIIAGKNWQNLKVLMPLGLLLAANAGFHLEAHYFGLSDISRRVAMAAVILLIMLIGGRIIPSFTRNWLVRNNPGRLPVPFNRFDVAAIVIAALAFVSWIVTDLATVSGFLMLLAAAFHFIRLFRWAGYRALKDPLVLVLHLSYLFIPIGFTLLGLAGFFPDFFSPLAGIHALGTGAIGSMTLSVMLRATLGHSGQPLRAGRSAKFIFAFIFLAAFTRLAAEFDIDQYNLLLPFSALVWFLAFTGFSIFYAPLFLRKKS